MRYVRLGEKEVFPIGLGTWHMGEDFKKRQAEISALQTGIEAGAVVIDTAEMYGEGKAEELVGQAIKPYSRENLYLISKIYPWNASKDQLMLHLNKSLERLQIDYLDLYLLHWPGKVPLQETVLALEEAKASGKIREWGVSNFDIAEMEELLHLSAGKNCVTNEVLYHLGSRGIEFDLLSWMKQHNLPLIAYSPIAQGDQLGNNFTQNTYLQELANAHNCSIFQLLLAWAIRDGQTIAIPQSSNYQHVKDNIAAAKLSFTQTEHQQLDHFFAKPLTKQPLAVL